MQLEKHDGSLTIRDGRIVVFRMIGVGMVVVVGLFLLWRLWHAVSGPPLGDIALLVFVSIFGVLAVIIGGFLALAPWFEKVVIDTETHVIYVHRWGPFSRSANQILGREVASINVEEDASAEGPTTYSLHVTLKSGKRQQLFGGLPSRPDQLRHQIEEAIGPR